MDKCGGRCHIYSGINGVENWYKKILKSGVI
jgi:hypothetical protein